MDELMRHVAQIVILLQYVVQQVNHTQVLQQDMVQIHSVLLVLRHHLLLHSLQHEEVYHGHVVHHKVEQQCHVQQTDQQHQFLVYVDEQMVKHMLTVQQVMVQMYNVQTVIVQTQPSLV